MGYKMENKAQTPVNHIKVSFRSSCRSLVNYAEKVLKEHNMRTLQFTAIGGAIGNLVRVVEILKVLHPGLYQNNTIGTVVHQTLENSKSVKERLYPKFEVEMSLDAPSKTTEGSQDRISEELRKEIENFKATAKPRERAPRGRGRGRGAPRGRAEEEEPQVKEEHPEEEEEPQEVDPEEPQEEEDSEEEHLEEEVEEEPPEEEEEPQEEEDTDNTRSIILYFSNSWKLNFFKIKHPKFLFVFI